MNKEKLPLNFLLGCTETNLDNFRLTRMSDVANLRQELYALFDKLIDQMVQVQLAEWFKANDRQGLKQAIENEESVEDWAKRLIRSGHDLESRIGTDPLAHRAAAVTYQTRNLAEGKCRICPKPLARNSVQHCEEHLAKKRVRARQKKGLSDPGGRDYLYAGEISESGSGRHPNSLASLAVSRVKKTRAVLAERGFPPEHAAVSLIAAKEAILRCLPASESEAMTQAELFEKACIPTRTTGQQALAGLLSAAQIQRIGKGVSGDPFRYLEHCCNF